MFTFPIECFNTTSYREVKKYHNEILCARTLDIRNFSENDLESYPYHYLCYHADFGNVHTILADTKLLLLWKLFDNNIFPQLKRIFIKKQSALAQHQALIDSLEKMVLSFPRDVYSKYDEYRISIFGEENILQLDDIININLVDSDRHKCNVIVDVRYGIYDDIIIKLKKEINFVPLNKTFYAKNIKDLLNQEISLCTTLNIIDFEYPSDDEDYRYVWNNINLNNVINIEGYFGSCLTILYYCNKLRSLQNIHARECPRNDEEIHHLIENKKMIFSRETNTFINIYCNNSKKFESNNDENIYASQLLHDFGDLLKPLIIKIIYPDPPLDLRKIVNKILIKMNSDNATCESCSNISILSCWVCLRNVCDVCYKRSLLYVINIEQYINICPRSECLNSIIKLEKKSEYEKLVDALVN